MEEPVKTGNTYNFQHSNVGGVQIDSHHSNQTIHQTIGPDLQQVIALLEQSKDHLAQLDGLTRKTVEEQIDHIKDEVKTGKPHLGKVKTFMTMAVMLASGAANFQSSMATVCEKLGVERQSIEQFMHPAKAK